MRRYRGLVGVMGLLVMALVLSGCLNLFAPKVGQVKGTVTYESGTPIANAEVKLDKAVAKTNAQGSFAFLNIKHGTYTLDVVVDGTTVYSQQVKVGNTPVIVNVKVPDPLQYGTIAGTVKLEDDTPVAGATVKLGERSTTTDATGAYEFEDVAYGEYTVTAEVDGEQYQAAANLNAPQITVDIVVPIVVSQGDVTGVVKDAVDRPVEGALVSLGTTQATTDAAGAFEFTGVDFGTYTIAVTVRGIEVYSDDVEVDDETVDFDIAVDVAWVVGHVLDQDDNPIEGAVIRLGSATTTTAVDGTYSFVNIPYALYTFTVEVDGAELHTNDLNVDQPDVVYSPKVTIPVAGPQLVYEEDFSGVTDLDESGWTLGTGWTVESLNGKQWIQADAAGVSHAYIRIPELADADVIIFEFTSIGRRAGSGWGAMIPANNPADPLGGENYFVFRKWNGLAVRLQGMGGIDMDIGTTPAVDTEFTVRLTFDRVAKTLHVLRDGTEFSFPLGDASVVPKGNDRDILNLYVNGAQALWTNLKVWVE